MKSKLNKTSLSTYLGLTAGAGAFSLVNSNAAIVAYQGPPLTITMGSNQAIYWNPLNSTASVGVYGQPEGPNQFLYPSEGNVYLAGVNASYLQNSTPVTISYDSSVVDRLSAGATISPSNTLWEIAYGSISKSGWTTADGPWATGQNGTRGYIGFEVLRASGPGGGTLIGALYGWADITYNAGNLRSLTLNAFAVETSGAPIIAGAVPEPSALLLLAAGGAGVLLARSRRRQKVSDESKG